MVTTTEQRRAGRSAWLAVLALLAIGAALRLYAAQAFPYEQDEIYTRIEATELFATRLEPGIDARPLYYLLMHPLLPVLGDSPFAMRLVPVLLSILGLWVTWELGRRTLGVTAGIVALIAAVVSPWHLHHSAMARYWALVYLLAALAYLLLQRAHDRDRPRDHLLALLVLLAGTATHPSFVFPMVGAVLGLTLVSAPGRVGWHWPSRRAWTWLWGPYLAALGVAFVALRLAGREDAVRNWAGRGLGATLRLVPAMVEWMTPLVFAAGALGALLLLTAGVPRARRWGAMASLGVLSTFGLLFAASFVTDAYADYGAAALPLVFVSVGGLAQLAAWRMVARAARLVPAVAGALLLAGVMPSTVSFLSDGTRFDYRGAYRRIAELDPTSPVLAWPAVLQKEYAPELRGYDLWRPERFRDSLLAAEGEVWAVVSVARYGVAGDDGALTGWLQRHCRPVERFERPRLDYRVYRVELMRCRRASVPPDAAYARASDPGLAAP